MHIIFIPGPRCNALCDLKNRSCHLKNSVCPLHITVDDVTPHSPHVKGMLMTLHCLILHNSFFVTLFTVLVHLPPTVSIYAWALNRYRTLRRPSGASNNMNNPLAVPVRPKENETSITIILRRSETRQYQHLSFPLKTEYALHIEVVNINLTKDCA